MEPDEIPLPTDEQIAQGHNQRSYSRPMFELKDCNSNTWNGAARWSPENGWGKGGSNDHGSH